MHSKLGLNRGILTGIAGLACALAVLAFFMVLTQGGQLFSSYGPNLSGQGVPAGNSLFNSASNSSLTNANRAGAALPATAPSSNQSLSNSNPFTLFWLDILAAISALIGGVAAFGIFRREHENHDNL